MKKLCKIGVLICLVTVPIFAKADESGIGENILCVEGIPGTDTVYAGTKKGLYVSENSGESWEKLSIPGSRLPVKDIAVYGKDVFLAAPGGIYKLGAENKIPGTAKWKAICAIACSGDAIYAADGGDIFLSKDEGKNWEKVPLLADKSTEGETEEEVEEAPEEDEAPVLIKSLNVSDNEDLIVSTRRGIFILKKGQGEYERIATTGLPASGIVAAVGADGRLFASTGEKIFTYSKNDGSWEMFLEPAGPGDISGITIHKDKNGKIYLLVARGSRLYSRAISNVNFLSGQIVGAGLVPAQVEGAPALPAGRHKGRPYISSESEPSITDVQRMAIEYAEVSPEKIANWRRGAQWKAFMPRLSVGLSESIDENNEIYTSSTSSYVVRGPKERGSDWDVDLSWELSDLVWNSEQTSIDSRSKLMVELRGEILEEVTRLYFERKKLMGEAERQAQSEAEGGNPGIISAKKIRVDELTAYIDAFTGGEFSKRLLSIK